MNTINGIDLLFMIAGIALGSFVTSRVSDAYHQTATQRLEKLHTTELEDQASLLKQRHARQVVEAIDAAYRVGLKEKSQDAQDAQIIEVANEA